MPALARPAGCSRRLASRRSGCRAPPVPGTTHDGDCWCYLGRGGVAAGVPPKVMSERLGHATVAFTLDTYTSALRAMDKSAARCGRRAHSWHRGSPGSKTREITMALSC